jgi:hypothetical protein
MGWAPRSRAYRTQYCAGKRIHAACVCWQTRCLCSTPWTTSELPASVSQAQLHTAHTATHCHCALPLIVDSPEKDLPERENALDSSLSASSPLALPNAPSMILCEHR